MVEAILRTLGVAEAARDDAADAAYSTARAALDLADFGGAAAVVLGRSPHLGAPLAKALAGRDATRGAAVVNVGTTYDASAKTLAPDVDDAADDAAYVLTTNAHGCGSACVATLVRRVVERAEDRALAAGRPGDLAPRGRRAPPRRRRPRPPRRCARGEDRGDLRRLDHHPTVAINGARVCHDVAGCGVAVEFTTFAAGGTLTVKDSEAARPPRPARRQ
ncbi:hypothetical protein JL721_7581 [Aureococcus anophagefferens]|nr:hypothetical protein JL721_7581 [Aureococcus anophagefferens]